MKPGLHTMHGEVQLGIGLGPSLVKTWPLLLVQETCHCLAQDGDWKPVA